MSNVYGRKAEQENLDSFIVSFQTVGLENKSHSFFTDSITVCVENHKESPQRY